MAKYLKKDDNRSAALRAIILMMEKAPPRPGFKVKKLKRPAKPVAAGKDKDDGAGSYTQ